eukprot:TRINITY_DN50053_c0_g1_i1.p1 TRINITY_DN50053_c0_g1~~TRINITY_DN50053_c0_g1_i1.p1  ORF type:complete len:330 (+),score=90.86 TRINITY_DN50053_c0_g1_i1:35-991(+)
MEVVKFDAWTLQEWDRLTGSQNERQGGFFAASLPNGKSRDQTKVQLVDPARAAEVLEAVISIADKSLPQRPGLSAMAVRARAAELQATEIRRLRGRLEMLDGASPSELQDGAGAFGSAGVAEAASRLVQAGASSSAYRAYCQWRAYNEALSGEGKEGDRAFFSATLGAGLLQDLLGYPRVTSSSEAKRDVEALFADLRILMAMMVARGLLAAWEIVDYDDVLGELWAERKASALSFGVLLVGDPLEDAQVVLAERRDSVAARRGTLVPDIVAQSMAAWLRRSLPSAAVTAESYYSGMRYGFVFGPGLPGQVRLQVTIS